MPDRLIRWVTLGRVSPGPKQIFIIGAAIFCILRGLAYVDPPPVPQGLTTLAVVLPLGVWGWAWIIAGAVALGAVHWRHYAICLTPMLVLSALWSFSYLAEWAARVLHGDESRDWITGVSYAFQALAVLIVSRLVDPTEVTATSESGTDA